VTKVAEIVAASERTGLDAAIEELLGPERVHRLAGNAPECAHVCVAMVRLCRQHGAWEKLNETVLLLSKRRAQLKQALSKVVQQAMEYIDETPDKAARIALIEALREVCEGKIYVELEEARLTRMLANIREADGDVDAAAAVMQDMQVETYGSMDRREKTEFILHQIRLCLSRGDFVRAAIIAKKITPRSIQQDDLADIRMRYHELMVQIYAHNGDVLEICRAYLARFETVIAAAKKPSNDTTAGAASLHQAPKVPFGESAWIPELHLVVFFLVLSEHSPMQVDLLHRVRAFPELGKLPLLADLLKQLVTEEIIRWSVFKERYEQELTSIYEAFKKPLICGEGALKSINWMALIHERVTEHNIRVVAKYYSCIRLKKLAALLDLSEDVAEQRLASQVSDRKAIYAKIDRPKGIVSFRKPQDADENLNEWATSVASLLDKVERTCHLVHKEVMVYGVSSDADSTSKATS